jgi:hypothetical protein
MSNDYKYRRIIRIINISSSTYIWVGISVLHYCQCNIVMLCYVYT